MFQRTLIAAYSMAMALSLVTIPAHAILASIKATGMAGVGVAFPQDSLSSVINPANITSVGNRIDVGAQAVNYSAEAQIEDNLFGLLIPGINGTFKNYGRWRVAPELGVSYQANCWLGFGFSVYNGQDICTKYKEVFPLLGTNPLKFEYTLQFGAVTAGIQLPYGNSIGVSLLVPVARLKARGIENFDNPLFSEFPGFVSNRGVEYVAGVGVNVGWKWDVCDWLAIGATYQPKIRMPGFKKYKGFLAEKGRVDVPAIFRAGIAIYVTPCTTVALDVRNIAFETDRSLHNDISQFPPAFRAGAADGIGFGWKNQWFYQAGINQVINDEWTVRAGYRYATPLFDRHNTAVNILSLSTVENAVTVGATWGFACNWELSGYYAYGFRKKINGEEDSIPLTIGGGQANVSQQLQLFGLSIGWCY